MACCYMSTTLFSKVLVANHLSIRHIFAHFGLHFWKAISKLEQVSFSEGYNDLQFSLSIPIYISL
jgi:hypothetical protein